MDDPRIRGMFTRESLLASDWYRERLHVKQSRDIALWQRHLKSLETFRSANEDGVFPSGLNLEERLSAARAQLARVSAEAYLEELVGTIGADPFSLRSVPARCLRLEGRSGSAVSRPVAHNPVVPRSTVRAKNSD